MEKETLLKEIAGSQEFFERSTRVLQEQDSNFKPTEGMLTVAQQVAHVAATIHWFVSGALSPEGFDLNFEKHNIEIAQVRSLNTARAQLQSAFGHALASITELSETEIAAPIVEGLIMGGEPRYHAFLGIIEHTAHHRGALTVYSRMLNKTPLMPYMEM